MKQYTEELKVKMVELVNVGERPMEVALGYAMSKSRLDKWVKKYNDAQSKILVNNDGISNILDMSFNIQDTLTCSFSAKGTSHDNSVCECTYHTIKTEFVFDQKSIL